MNETTTVRVDRATHDEVNDWLGSGAARWPRPSHTRFVCYVRSTWAKTSPAHSLPHESQWLDADLG